MAGFRLTTKVQVSGWRFLLRRVEHAVVRRDTRMFDDPIRFYSRSMGTGIAIAVLVCLGAVLLAYFKPLGKRSNDTLLVDRATNQLYAIIPGSDQLRPVYNLTSARLILGNQVTPSVVKSAELDRLPKGQPIGIPGAPYSTTVTAGGQSTWMVCDNVTDPKSVTPVINTSVGGTVDSPTAPPLRPNQAALVSYRDPVDPGGPDTPPATWLINSTGRHAIDLNDRALTSAVGIPVNVSVLPISEGLFNALPNQGPWQLPQIPNAGAPNTVGLSPDIMIGSVIQTVDQSGTQNYVVLPNGVARVNGTTANALRNMNSYGQVTTPKVEPSVVSKIREETFSSPLPNDPLQVIARDDYPALCWAWSREAGDQNAVIRVISSRTLPIPGAIGRPGVKQISGPYTVYVDGGKFIQLQSPDPKIGESRYFIDPQGVRYGVPFPTEGNKENGDAAASLGLSSPQFAPWQAVKLLIEGPVLSKQAALIEHDTLPSDPNPRAVGGDDKK